MEIKAQKAGLAVFPRCYGSLFFYLFLSYLGSRLFRYHLPLFILFSPLIGVLVGPSWKWFVKFITILLFTTACLTIYFHQTRPLKAINMMHNFPHEAFYFMKKPPHYWSYGQVAHIIHTSGCLDVGLIEGPPIVGNILCGH